MSGRAGAFLAIALCGACGVTVESEEEETASIGDEPTSWAPRCPPDSQLAFAERFSNERGSWPSAWILSTTGGGPARESAGELSAAPGATSRATMEAPLDVASVRMVFSFEPGASQEIVLGLFGSEARTAPPLDGAGFDVRIAQGIDGEVGWALHRADSVTALPRPPARGGRSVVEARVSRRSNGAEVELSLWSEASPAPKLSSRGRLEDLEPLGPLTIAAANRGETHRAAALRVHEIVVCTATP